MARLFAIIAITALMATTISGQAQSWRVGKSGDGFNQIALTQSGALEVDGGLQPLELREGANLIELLTETGLVWANGQPTDFVAAGQPRAWSNDTQFNLIDGPLDLLDGDPNTSTDALFKAVRNQSGAAFFFDLGAPFPLNRIRFFPAEDDPDSFIEAFAIFVNDGVNYNDIRRPLYEELRRVEVNKDIVVDLEFASLQGRFLRLLVLSKTAFNLAEFEIYGEGFVPIASYESELHSFDAPVNFGDLTLHATRLLRDGGVEAEDDEGPTAVFQMRTGADETPNVYFRRDRDTGSQFEVEFEEYDKRLPRQALFQVDPSTKQILGEVNRSTYLALPVAEQGPIRDFVKGDIRGDVDNWSAWSPSLTIDSTGTLTVPIDLFSPREYLQFRVAFTGDADNVMRIDSLEIEHFPRLVSTAIGELALADDPNPADGIVEVPGGIDTAFVYDLRTEFDSASLPGFRGIRVEAFPPPVFTGLLSGDPLQPVEGLQEVKTEQGFDVFFDPVNISSSFRLLFDLRLLEHNTPVKAWLIGEGDAPPHPVHPGNASAEISTSVTHAFSVETRPIVEARASTSVITPNDDGRNDKAEILLILSQFVGGIEVEAEILDLSGRRVRRLVFDRRAAGAYDEDWDGRDDGGDLVPPGLYILRLAATTDAETFHSAKILGVAY